MTILVALTPFDKAKVTNTSPDDSEPVKLFDANCTINTIVMVIKQFDNLKQMITIFKMIKFCLSLS